MRESEQLKDEDLFNAIGQITLNFKILECDKCAKAIMQWLAQKRIKGKVIRLRTASSRQFHIISERLEQKGIRESITDNGVHYGVEVRGRVFDNLSAEGLPKEQWLKDFHCPTEQFIFEELDKL